MNGFTKLYKEERELLRKINTGSAYEVYMHLKDKYRYYNTDVYSYMKCIAEYLEMSEITVKRTIKKLKEVGLIECRREWVKSDGVPKSSNYYSFPIVDMIEKSENKEEETPKEENNNTELQPNTEFDTEAKISPNEPYLATNDIDVPQEGESLPEAKIEAKEEEIIIDTDNTEEMGTYIGTLSNFAIVETRDANSQKPIEELQRQTIERENRKEEYTANFNKAYNIQTASVSEPTKRIEIEKDRSMEYMEKCLSRFDLNKAKHQISRAKSVDENMKRVADCLDNLLDGFSKEERSRFYISIIEDVLNSK